MKSNTFAKKLNGKGLRVAVVRARFNEKITDGLLRGCLKGLRECGVHENDIVVYEVPGSFELPFTTSLLAQVERFDAIIALGAIIKGETKHDEYIANAVAQGITNASIEKEVPIILGVITPNNLEQAVVRSSNDKINKGYEAAMAAVAMGLLVRKIRSL